MDPNFRYSSRYMPPQTPTTPFINSSPYPHPLHNPSLSLAHTHVHSLPHAMTHPQPHLHPHPHPQIHSHPPSHSHSHPYHFPRPFIPSNNPHLAESQLNMKMSDLVLHEDKPMKGEPKACLFVASLNAQRTDEQLTESVTKHFCKWGKLMNVKVMKDWMHRPYAFVQYNVCLFHFIFYFI
ncbi:hypothetical protein HMI55_004440 [Coelomomyces lativittatus]|nr:hypothetical protein HMI55_004440 [Coelomomyces lativittatus]